MSREKGEKLPSYLRPIPVEEIRAEIEAGRRTVETIRSFGLSEAA